MAIRTLLPRLPRPYVRINDNAELPRNQGRVQLGRISGNPAGISVRLVRIRMPYREFTGVFFYKQIHRADLFLPVIEKKEG